VKECDFCSAHEELKIYPCRSFDSDSRNIGVRPRGWTVELRSQNDWYACPACGDLIDAMDIEGLVNRVIAVFWTSTDDPRVREAFRQHIGYTYQLFFLNRIQEEKPDENS
jgi:hypothetical protein